MNDTNSILDKVMQSQQMQDASQFIPSEFVLKLLKNLNSKERDILIKRFGLDGNDSKTLEQIGKDFEITRERIRQIQMSAIKKIKDLQELKEEMESIQSLIKRLLEEHGGLMEENHLLEKLLSYSDDNITNRQAAMFILEHLLEDGIERITNDTHFLPGWKINILPPDKAKQAIITLQEIIELENRLMKLEELTQKFVQHNFYKENQEIFTNDLSAQNQTNIQNLKKKIESYLRISRNIDKNIMEEWGLNSWNTIKPKRMSDKVYMILRKEKNPLHFREIADYINKANFDSKVAHPATIHNELILNEKFILIGRGIYALAEWGYKPGTVADVIIDILKNSTKPLTKEEIIQKVLQTRMVKKSTINLALTDKSKFKKVNSGYQLA